MIKKAAITFFGLGYLPIAPGTWGSFGALFIFWIAAYFCANVHMVWGIFFGVAVLCSFLGIVLGPWAVSQFQSKDPKPDVLDEAAGMWLAMLVPYSAFGGLFVVGCVQFILFRIFDILKPTPARQIESLPHGWGIMADDLVAGIYANIVGQIFFRFILPHLT